MNLHFKLLFILFCISASDLVCQTEAIPKNGIVINYYDNGKIQFALKYKNNKLDSTCVWYFQNGKPSTIINFKDGVKHGSAHYFSENGTVEKIAFILNDTTLTSLQFDSKGILFSETSKGIQKFYIKGTPYTNQEYINKKSRKK